MNKKRIISIVILVLGVIMISSGLIITSLNNKDKNPKPESGEIEKPDEEIEEPSDEDDGMSDEYREAYNTAVSLYQYGDNTVEVEEKEDKFVIYVKNPEGEIINTFNMDKKTGAISEEPITSEESAGG